MARLSPARTIMWLPDDPAEAFSLGNAYLERGDAIAAVAAFQRCLDGTPDHAATLFNLANARLQAGQTLESAETFVRCLRRAPAFGPAHVNLANALLRLGLIEQARGFAASGVHLMPGSPDALLCLAGILHHAGEHAAAVEAYQDALRQLPNHGGALSSLGNSLRALGRIQEARQAHDQAIASVPENDPTHAVYRFHRATMLLMAGDYANGWWDYEWRWRRPGFPPRFASEPWRGGALGGCTVLLHSEQGLGDTLQFVRYAPLVAECGGRVILQVQPSLVRLLRSMPGVTQVIAQGTPLPPHDCHCPLMSLPLACVTRLSNVPAPLAYLRAGSTHADDRRDHPTDDRALRVGLAWTGLPNLDHWEARLIGQSRSLRVPDLAGLADLPGVQFISLQKDVPPPPIQGLEMIDARPGMGDFADTAVLVASLDLVVSVDTSVAHLAGALGRPTWLLLRYDACWRWLRDRSDSPWYPTMRLYRQSRPNHWSDVIACVRHDLEKLATQRVRQHRPWPGPCAIPAPPGPE